MMFKFVYYGITALYIVEYIGEVGLQGLHLTGRRRVSLGVGDVALGGERC